MLCPEPLLLLLPAGIFPERGHVCGKAAEKEHFPVLETERKKVAGWKE